MTKYDDKAHPAAKDEWEHTRTPTKLDDVITSGGARFRDLPEFARSHVIWIDGLHGGSRQVLPSIEDLPVPDALLALPRLHPERPRGSKPMLDVHGARSRLQGCRPGAWIISAFTGWKWAKWPDGDVGWLPATVILPDALRVRAFDDLN